MKKYEFQEKLISELKPAKFNPLKRTLPAKLGGLMGSIASHGMPVPIVITANNEIGDGHRRLACAKALGWELVPVVVWDGLTAQQIWSILNAHQMSMSPAQWLEAVVCGLPVDQPEIPKSLSSTIKELLDILDEDTVWRIVEEGKSPEILKTARWVASKLGWLDTDNNERVKRIIKWFLEYNAQAKARYIIGGDYGLDTLAEAIEAMRDVDMVIQMK